MSPALLNKYLQAAREVANHMVLKPDGFDFAPHPMLVETDREKYCIQRIVDFYDRQPTDYADYFQAAWRYKHRAALGKPKATLADIAAQKRSQREVSADGLADARGARRKKSDRSRSCRRCGARCRRRAQGSRICSARSASRCAISSCGSASTRRWNSPAPVVKGLSAASQPLMNWKIRAVCDAPPRFRPRRAARRRAIRRRSCRTMPDDIPGSSGRPNGEDLTRCSALAEQYESRMRRSRSRGSRRPARPLRGRVRALQLPSSPTRSTFASAAASFPTTRRTRDAF